MKFHYFDDFSTKFYEAEHLLLDRGVQLLLHLQVLAGGLGVRVQVEGRAVRDADLCSTPGPRCHPSSE